MASSGTIGKINAGGNDYLVASTAFAVCNTSANIAAKVATIQDSADFTLMDGVTIHVYFDSTNTAASPTLNVNNTGAHSIYFANNIDTAVQVGVTPTDSWAPGAIITFTYYNKEGSGGIWYINNNAPDIFPVVFTPTSQDFTTATSSKRAFEIALALGNGQMPLGLLMMGQNLFALSYLAYAGTHPLTSQYVAVFNYSCFSTNVLTHLGYHYATITVDNSGNVTIEWTDLVKDVTLDGNGVVTDGIAELATGTSSGTLAAGDHTHGNITNGGDITTNVAIASGDRLVINDESESKINNSSITFGTSTTQFLANNGTWQTPAGGGGVDSTDTSNKIFLIGAETQAADVTTYSDNQVYATNGQLDANKVRIAEHATLQYNSTDSAIEFVFT